MKSLLFQSNISKTRYSKNGVILNLLLDSLCPIMMTHGRGQSHVRYFFSPPSHHNNTKKGVQRRDRQIYRNFSILNRKTILSSKVEAVSTG